MIRTRRWTGMVITALAIAPLALSGQAGPRRGPAQGRDATRGSVEQVMRMRDRLALSEQQVAELDQIRQELVAERAERQARIAELRSRTLAGQADGEELREAMQAEREALGAQRESQRERVLAVLDEAQRDSLEQLGARARAFRMGRESGLRGRGPERPGLRGGRPGMQRQRFPGMRPGGFGPRPGLRGPDPRSR